MGEKAVKGRGGSDDVINSQQHEAIESAGQKNTHFSSLLPHQSDIPKWSESGSENSSTRAELSIFGNSGEKRGDGEMKKKKGKGKGGVGQNSTSGFDQSRTDVDSAAGPLNLSSSALLLLQRKFQSGGLQQFSGRVSRSFCQSQQQQNVIHSKKRFYSGMRSQTAGKHEAN